MVKFLAVLAGILLFTVNFVSAQSGITEINTELLAVHTDSHGRRLTLHLVKEMYSSRGNAPTSGIIVKRTLASGEIDPSFGRMSGVEAFDFDANFRFLDNMEWRIQADQYDNIYIVGTISTKSSRTHFLERRLQGLVNVISSLEDEPSPELEDQFSVIETQLLRELQHYQTFLLVRKLDSTGRKLSVAKGFDSGWLNVKLQSSKEVKNFGEKHLYSLAGTNVDEKGNLKVILAEKVVNIHSAFDDESDAALSDIVRVESMHFYSIGPGGIQFDSTWVKDLLASKVREHKLFQDFVRFTGYTEDRNGDAILSGTLITYPEHSTHTLFLFALRIPGDRISEPSVILHRRGYIEVPTLPDDFTSHFSGYSVAGSFLASSPLYEQPHIYSVLPMISEGDMLKDGPSDLFLYEVRQAPSGMQKVEINRYIWRAKGDGLEIDTAYERSILSGFMGPVHFGFPHVFSNHPVNDSASVELFKKDGNMLKLFTHNLSNALAPVPTIYQLQGENELCSLQFGMD